MTQGRYYDGGLWRACEVGYGVFVRCNTLQHTAAHLIWYYTGGHSNHFN